MAFSVCKTLLQTGFKTHLNEKRTLNSHWWPWSSYREYVSYIHIYMYIYILVSYNPSSYMFSSDNAISRHSNNTSLHPAAIPSQVQRARWSSLGEVIWMNGAHFTCFFCSLSSNFSIWWYCTCFLVRFCLSPIEEKHFWYEFYIIFNFNKYIYIFLDTHICGRAMNVQRSEMFLCTQETQISTTC